MNRRPNRWGLLLALAAAAATLGAALPPLSDLRSHRHQVPVYALAFRGTVEGFPDGTFRPDDPLTRAQAAKMLALALGQDQAARRAQSGTSSFSDMRGHWAMGTVEVLAELGLMKGYPGGTFRPDNPVSRLELVLLAARAAGVPAVSRPDAAALDLADAADIPAWALPEVAAAAASGLLRDVFPDRLLHPREPATRAVAAALVARVAGWRGALFHLEGTILSWDTSSWVLTLQTPAGEQVKVPTTPSTRFFRSGAEAIDLRPGDQAWVMLDGQGNAAMVETRFLDLSGQDLRVLRGSQIRFFSLRTLGTVTLEVASGAPVFLNGVRATLSEVDGAQRVYVVLDEFSGRVRVLDAVRYQHYGRVYSYDPDTRELVVLLGTTQSARRLKVDPGAIVFVDGTRVTPEQIPPAVPVMVAMQDERVTYLQTDR